MPAVVGSRLGKRAVALPEKVKVAVDAGRLSVQGPLGSLEESLPPPIELQVEPGRIWVRCHPREKRDLALHGLYWSKVRNMVEGVTQGFTKVLEIHGVGYRAQVEAEKITWQLGFSHPLEVPIPKGLKIHYDAKQGQLAVSGISKEAVGAFAAQLRSLKPPEPYKATGIRYRGEHIARKAGKTAAGVGAKKT